MFPSASLFILSCRRGQPLFCCRPARRTHLLILGVEVSRRRVPSSKVHRSNRILACPIADVPDAIANRLPSSTPAATESYVIRRHRQRIRSRSCPSMTVSAILDRPREAKDTLENQSRASTLAPVNIGIRCSLVFCRCAIRRVLRTLGESYRRLQLYSVYVLF
jgi:hypothetical protein